MVPTGAGGVNVPEAASHLGSMALVLHAHLPYVRHPEHPLFLEEDWLYEAITETYVPLLAMMDSLRRDGVPFRLTMSLTPPLCEMLADPLLRERYAARLDALIELATRRRQGAGARRFEAAADDALATFERVRHTFAVVHGSDLLAGFRHHQDAGGLHIVTCGATHGLLPLMAHGRGATRAGRGRARTTASTSGAAAGIWLAECAYRRGSTSSSRSSRSAILRRDPRRDVRRSAAAVRPLPADPQRGRGVRVRS